MEGPQESAAGVRKRHRREKVPKSGEPSAPPAPVPVPMASAASSPENKLEKAYGELSDKVADSIVIVKEPVHRNYFVGFVADHSADKKGTIIFTSSSFPMHSTDLLVHFKDGNEVNARVLVRQEQFSLLIVKYNAEFKPIKFVAEDVNVQTEAVIFAPTSDSSCSQIPDFIIQPSNPAGDIRMRHIEGSENDMLVSCHFYGKVVRGSSQLASSPIFNLKCEAVGIVSRNLSSEPADPNANFHPNIKVGIRASAAKIIFYI